MNPVAVVVAKKMSGEGRRKMEIKFEINTGFNRIKVC